MKQSFSRNFSSPALFVSASTLAAYLLLGCSSEDGAAGTDGADGVDGVDGTDGARGPSGSDGPSGEEGATGARGPRGRNGSRGTDGKDGANGTNGTDGSDAAPPFDVRGILSHEIFVGGAEMLDVSVDGRYVLVAGDETATLLEVGLARLTHVSTLTLPPEHRPEGANLGDFTGMSIHPSGEYALIAVRDVEHAAATGQEVPGKVLALSIPSLAVVGEVTVGIGPDSVDIAPNGLFAVVANEDEENELDLTNLNNRAGTVSIIDLRDGPLALSQVEVPIPAEGIPYFSHDPQPETVKVSPDSSFILATLQENNAIARVEIPTPLPTPLTADVFSVTSWNAGVRSGLGLVSGSIGSASCKPSGYDLSLREQFTSAREPDGVAFTTDGRFFVTADEDNLTFANGQMHEGELLSRNGARTISVYDASTGELLGDSGNSIENAVIARGLPQRCGSKGPEPEVVDVAEIRGRQLAFVSILVAGAAFGLFQWSQVSFGHSVSQARTIAVNTIVVVEVGYLFACRSLRLPIWKLAPFENRWIWLGSSLMLLAQLAFTYLPVFNKLFHTSPIEWFWWVYFTIAGIAVLLLVEAYKWLARTVGSRD